MSLRIFILGVATTILSAGLAPSAGAQVWQPFGPVNYRHDFAPFETFDIKNMSAAPDPHEGYFFTFDKLHWAVQGENNVIGNPNVVDFMPAVVGGLEPPQIFNGLQDSAPEATFGWGERYEFGYVIDHHGWAASVLDGPDATDSEVYGFNGEVLDDPRNDADFVFDVNGAVGNVVILFEFPQNGSLGFLINENGIPFDLNLDGVINNDDLISIVPTFEQVTVRNSTQLDGVELMKTYRFKPSPHGSVVEFSYGARYLRLHDNFRVDAYGGPFNEIEIIDLPAADSFITDRTSFWDTTIDNHIVGPQVALRWTKRQGRFTYNASGRFTFGYNVQDHDQVGQVVSAHDYEGPVIIEVDGVPPTGTAGIFVGDAGPIFLQNSAFRHGKQEDAFSPLVEFRTGLNYHITQDFAVTLGFNATFIDNVRRASPSVAYVLPNMGFRDSGTQEIFTAGVNVGVEFNR